MMQNYKSKISVLKKDYDCKIRVMKSSFAEEIEELHHTVSTQSLQLSALAEEKHYHGQKFIEILNKAKEKNKILKNSNKKLINKQNKYEGRFEQITQDFNLMEIQKEERENTIDKLEKSQVEHLNTIKDLSKKLYNVDAQDDLAQLDPYELHKKIRYYETQIKYQDKDNMEVRKELGEIKNYLEILGISKKDLLSCSKTGILQLNNFNGN